MDWRRAAAAGVRAEQEVRQTFLGVPQQPRQQHWEKRFTPFERIRNLTLNAMKTVLTGFCTEENGVNIMYR